MPENNQSFLTKTVIITAAAIGICLCFLTLIIQFMVFPNIIIENKEKMMVEITPVSATSMSQIQSSGQTDQQTSTDTPAMKGVIAIGMNIKVNGTGNEGLRMRSDAGIEQTTLYLAQEGELFEIIDGPKIIDGLIWWKIKALNDSKKIGWSVQDYMVTN